jgi:hypothetical protein
MEVIVPHKEMVAEGAGLSSGAGTVLRKPYREISLPTKRISPKVLKKIIIVAIPVAKAEVLGIWISFYVIRPESFLVSMRKSPTLSAMRVRSIRPGPDLPSGARISSVPGNPFLKMLVSERQIGQYIFLPMLDLLISPR